MIRVSRKVLINQFDTSLIHENIAAAGGRDAHQVRPPIVVFYADRVLAHGSEKVLNPPESSCVIQRATKPAPNIYRDVTRGGNESLNVYSEFPISASRGETAVTLRPVLQRFRATMFQIVAATNSIAPL